MHYKGFGDILMEYLNFNGFSEYLKHDAIHHNEIYNVLYIVVDIVNVHKITHPPTFENFQTSLALN